MPKHKEKHKSKSHSSPKRSKSRSPSLHRRHHHKHKMSRSRSRSQSAEPSYYKDSSKRHGRYRNATNPVESKSSERLRDDPDSKDERLRKSKQLAKFDINDFKFYFDRMFFRDYDVIKRGSQQYQDFWKFYHKVQNLQKQKQVGIKGGAGFSRVDSEKIKITDTFSIPAKFSKIFTVPLHLKRSDCEDYILKLNPDDQAEVRRLVPMEVITEFAQTLLYFLDFLQKDRFNKLKKLRVTQAALPIASFRESIISTLEKSNVLIIAGDTGCGKSTQVPQYLLDANYINIACTQPRRIACISLCKRVAFETLNEYGSEIGYQIRFEKSKTQHTKLVFLTEGLLLRQVSTDSMLTTYNVIVLDEVHERHLHGDFLLGIVKCLLYQRDDVKVILMSATINTQLFQDYFQGLAPIIQVPGRLYPIKMQYRPVSIEEMTTKSGKLNPFPYVRILQLIDDKYPVDERGDVLMFLSGMNEITTVSEAAQIYADQSQRWIILPLHSSLSITDQDKAFDYPPEGIRKCIISTNIAETSITIDGIRFVVDSGKVKEMAYDPACKMQRLKEFWISKASAEQRKGRAGRTGPGVCYRLYAESEYEELEAYSTPEIQRVPLDSLMLQMIALGIPDCRKFPFIEPPAFESIESSILRLKEQAALTEDEQLTPIGKTLSQLPVDVTIGKMLIMGTVFDQIDAVLSLAAALSVQSPFTNWAHRDPECVAARKTLDSDHGDPLTLLNAYRAWLEEKSDQNSRTKKWCKRRGFEEQRFYEMTKLRQQFKSLLTDSKLIKDSSIDPSQMSSQERSMRHGELKQLRNIKRDFHQSAPRKKKFLKLNEDFAVEKDEELEDDDIDIRDVEFRLRNDARQVKNLLYQSTPFGYEDLLMLKVILASGLYPQLGIPDDFNKYKGDSEQMFHTRGKGFTVLHPMSIFSNQPDVLKLNDSDVITVPHMKTKLSISNKHQILFFLTLLETNKPYLINTFRMPAVQTLLLFAHSVDTNPDFTRFVFDSWIEVEFADAATSRTMVLTAFELRKAWTKLLAQRLAQGEEAMSAVDSRKGRELGFGLVSFLRNDIFYTIRRLLAADQKDLYDRHFNTYFEEDAFEFEVGCSITPNPAKGGISLTSYFTYGSLYGELPDPEEWSCPVCELKLMTSPLDLLLHQAQCRLAKSKEAESQIVEEDLKARPLAKSYYCSTCQKQMHLLPIEILRHKKSHQTEAQVPGPEKSDA